MGKLLEGFKILCTDFDQILEKLFKGGYCSREGTNQRNTVYIFDLKVTKINVGRHRRQLSWLETYKKNLKFKPITF